MVGSAIAAGALSGLGFWAAAFYERHTSLGTGGSAGLVGVLILVGAITGTFVAGRVVDRIRDRYEGAPMLLAGVCQGVGALLLLPTFLDVPLWFRIPVQGVAVAFIVGGLVAIPVMITEVVPPIDPWHRLLGDRVPERHRRRHLAAADRLHRRPVRLRAWTAR